MGEWPRHMEVFLAADLQTEPDVSLMFAMGCLLAECPGAHTGSPEQLGEEVTIKRYYFRQFR